MASEREKIIAAARDHAALVAQVAVQLRVKPEAMSDFMRRGFERFEHEPFTEQAAQAWGKSQQIYAAHLFAAPEQQRPAGTPAVPQQTPTRDYMAIPDPAARLTAFRADQEKAAKAAQP